MQATGNSRPQLTPSSKVITLALISLQRSACCAVPPQTVHLQSAAYYPPFFVFLLYLMKGAPPAFTGGARQTGAQPRPSPSMATSKVTAESTNPTVLGDNGIGGNCLNLAQQN
eukprot:1146249-Pelagomonas_calceolata.AAC.6